MVWRPRRGAAVSWKERQVLRETRDAGCARELREGEMVGWLLGGLSETWRRAAESDGYPAVWEIRARRARARESERRVRARVRGALKGARQGSDVWRGSDHSVGVRALARARQQDARRRLQLRLHRHLHALRLIISTRSSRLLAAPVHHHLGAECSQGFGGWAGVRDSCGAPERAPLARLTYSSTPESNA
eukprot:1170316-Rhodomonas_salina.2